MRTSAPAWLAAQVEEGSWDRFRSGLRVIPGSIVVGAGIWFMRRWDARNVIAGLNAICHELSPAPDSGAPALASRIGRLLPWEFDDRYDTHVDAHFGHRFPPVDAR